MSAAVKERPFTKGLVVLMLALASSVIAWLLIAPPVFLLSDAALEKHRGHFSFAYAHVFGGTVMLFLGLANLYIGTTRRFWRYHKAVGISYLLGGALGSLSAIAISASTAHKAVGSPTFTNASVSLLGLSTAWIIAAAMGYRAARNRRYDSHRQWMIRSYVLVWSFVFCRLASRVPSVEDLGGGSAFIWLSWVGPLVLAEVFLQWNAGSNNSSKPMPLRGTA